MAPYEITNPGGSIEHWNEEAGSVWMKNYDHIRQINLVKPVPEEHGIIRLQLKFQDISLMTTCFL